MWTCVFIGGTRSGMGRMICPLLATGGGGRTHDAMYKENFPVLDGSSVESLVSGVLEWHGQLKYDEHHCANSLQVCIPRYQARTLRWQTLLNGDAQRSNNCISSHLTWWEERQLASCTLMLNALGPFSTRFRAWTFLVVRLG